MKRVIMLFLIASSICLGYSHRRSFVRIRDDAKDANWTVQDVIDANDLDIKQLIGFDAGDPNDVQDMAEYKRFKKGMKLGVKARIKERKRIAREISISLPGLTQIVQSLKASGNLTTEEAKAELLRTFRDNYND